MELKYFYKIQDNKLIKGSGFKIPDGFIEYDKDNPPQEFLDLQNIELFNKAKTDKINEIKQAFNDALEQGYTCSNGIKMDAKSDDIILLKSGYDLAQSLGQDTMTITDYDNIDHTDIALDDVYTMIQELGVNFETQRVKKNSLKAQVDACTSTDEVDSIVWS